MAEPVCLPDGLGYALNAFTIPFCYEQDLKSVLIPEGMVRDRTRKLASQIQEKIGDRPLMMLCVLKGSYRFFTLLADELTLARSAGRCRHPIGVDFMRASSYVDTASMGSVQLGATADLASQVAGQHVLVVDDIVDTGRTMQSLLEQLRPLAPASTSVACLLRKRLPTRRAADYAPDFLGFEIPDEFVVGYGLDYNQKFRDLNHICIMNESGIKKYKSE